MSVCRQAVRARRKARQDPRYRQNRKDATARAAKYQRQLAEAQARQQRSKKK